MKKSKGRYAGAQAPQEAGMRLRSCSHRKLDGVTFRSGQSYPADDPIVAKYRFHFRVAAFPPSVEPEPEPEPATETERLADPEE
tara:strand:- start:8945 stop:9196 length:252 start_codon:yes stop_codon:yes gene_type:complete